MSDQDYREIHLSGKQLVFLFMASLVLAVAIFLLGVSVGRGVRGAATAAGPAVTDEPAAATTEQRVALAEIPPATETTPGDLGYHDQLLGQTPPPAAAPPPSRADAAPEPPAPADEAPAASSAPVTAKPAPSAPTTQTPTAKPTTPAGDRGWLAQVGAFRSKPNADLLVSQLKAKGFAAFTDVEGGLNRVVVGPFADRPAAEQAAVRLRTEGFKPLITR